MHPRALGNTGIEIVPLMLGGNVFGWTANREQTFAILDRFTHRGFNFIDTADVYSRWASGHQGGESESLLGEWLERSGKRNNIVLATKVGMDMGDGRQGLRRAYILEAAEASLRRLRTDHIDLYQSHRDDEATPLEETLEAYARLIEQGKVRAIGASNYTGARLTEALRIAEEHNLPGYTMLQPEYNLVERRGFETDLLPVAERHGIGVIPYYSLAAGFLTGKYSGPEDAAGKTRGARVAKYFDDRGRGILAALRAVADETGAAQASVALAWLLAQPTIVAPIASATSPGQLDALFAAVDLQLSPEQIERLTQASAYPA